MRRFTVLVLASMLACGGEDSNESRAAIFAIAIDDGREVRAPAGVTTYVFLTSVGAEGRAVVYGAENLPPFATLSGDSLAITPSRADAGSYDVKITAWAGDATDTKVLRITAEAPNRAPELMMPWLSDALYERESVPGSGSSCMLAPRLRATPRDLDGDPMRLEIEVVPSGAAFRREPSQVTEWGGGAGYDATYAEFRVDVVGLAPNGAFDVSIRAVDRAGAASPWVIVAESLVCVPIGLVAPYAFDGVYSGETKIFALEVAGVGDAPFEITASGLPPFARLEGTTLTVTAPVVTSVRVYWVELVLTARGFTYARRSVPLYVRP